MASLSNINGIFDVHSTGAILFSTSHGTSGQILRSNGNAAPTWVAASTVIGGPYLPLSGGTLSGATATASGISFTVGGALTASGGLDVNGNILATVANNGTIKAQYNANNTAHIQANSSGGVISANASGTNKILLRSYGDSYFTGGNVGVGITNPSFGLVVSRNALAGTINDGVLIGMESTTNAANVGYRLKSGGEYYQVLYNGSSIQWKNYDAAYNTKMTLTNDGDLEIKGNLIINKFSTTSPYANGEIRFTGRYDRYVGGIKTFTDNASYPEYSNGLDFFVQRHVYALPNGHLAMRIDSKGNVGIGTTPFPANLTPQTVLDIGNAASVWGYQNYAYLIANAYYNVGWLYKNNAPAGVLQIAGDELSFRQAGSGTANTTVTYNQPFTIKASGNVGIGTTNPGAKLTISGGDIYQLGSSGGYSQTKILPKTTPNYPSAASSGTPQNWYQPVRGESGIIYYGNVNNSGGEYRCAGFVVFSAAESNNTPVAITIAATESIGAHMLAFSTASGWIKIQNTYGYSLIVMGRVESFVP